MEDIPYSKSIDYLLERNPGFWDEITDCLFDNFKSQWLKALPDFNNEQRQKAIHSMEAILGNPQQAPYHRWAKWLINQINTEDTHGH